jgi:hypothetical protein
MGRVQCLSRAASARCAVTMLTRKHALGDVDEQILGDPQPLRVDRARFCPFHGIGQDGARSSVPVFAALRIWRTRDLMRSRLALLSMVVCLTFGTPGTGLAFTGLSADQASLAQYPDTHASGGKVLPNAGAEHATDERSPGGLGEDDIEAGGVQQSRQVEVANLAGGNTFNGLSAIPILLFGAGVISTVLIRRRSLQGDG